MPAPATARSINIPLTRTPSAMDRPRPVGVVGFVGPIAPDFVVTGVTLNPLDPLASSTFSATIAV